MSTKETKKQMMDEEFDDSFLSDACLHKICDMGFNKEFLALKEDIPTSPRRAKKMDLENSLAELIVGNTYRHYYDDEIYLEGEVLSNDGVTSIIRVSDRYEESTVFTLTYEEVRQYFPSFHDDKATPTTDYLCLDVETKSCLFWCDPESGAIMNFDAEGLPTIPADVPKFREERNKKLFLYESQKAEEIKKRMNKH